MASQTTGLPLSGIHVTVQNYPAGTSATIYSTNDFSNPITQPLVTGIDGQFWFYAVDGHYQVIATPPGLPPIITDVIIQDLLDETTFVATATLAAATGSALVGDTTGGGLWTTVKGAINWLYNFATVTVPATYAALGGTMYIGTTAVTTNRAYGALVLTGITSIDGSAATATNATNLLGVASSSLPSIDCIQAAGALTFSAVAQYMAFHNASQTNGTPNVYSAAPSNLVLASGGTLGAVTTVSARIILVEMDNAGTAELAIANIAGGLDMSETGLISTTAIGAGSTAANVWYSTTARTNLAYRVIGAFDAVNTAGAWASPTTKLNAGGNALTAMSSLGYGQTWQNVGASRTLGTTYYTIAKPIQLNVEYISTSNASLLISINGGAALTFGTAATTIGIQGHMIIPAGASYVLTISAGTPTQIQWYELR